MKSLSAFQPFVLPFVYGCSGPLARQAILSSCIDFCARTMIVQATSYENAVADQPSYFIDVPAQQQVVKVLSVFFGETRLRARALEEVSSGVVMRGTPIGALASARGTPTEWVVIDLAEPEVAIYPMPDAAAQGMVTIRAAFAPTRTAKSVPDILFDDYAEDIGRGAVARLLATPNQPFSSPLSAKTWQDQFDSAVHSAANLARVGLGAGASRVRSRPFA